MDNVNAFSSMLSHPIVAGLIVLAIAGMASRALSFINQARRKRPQTEKYHKWYWRFMKLFPRAKKAFKEAK